MSVKTPTNSATRSLCDRVKAASPGDQEMIARFLDAPPKLRNSLAPILVSAESDDRATEFGRSIIKALTDPELLEILAPIDPLASARLRGVKIKHNLLYESGQPLRSEEVAQLLGISRQAVDKRRSKGQLLAVSLGKRGYYYPLGQFQEHGVIKGLDRVLAALAKFDPWTQLMFLKTGDLRLNNRTPLECLIAGDIDAVVSAAACYGEPNPA